MLSWNDAFTVDESRRQDKLVDSEIQEARHGPWRALGMMLVCLGLAAAGFFVFENNVAGVGFLALPVMYVIASMIPHVRSLSSRDEGPSARGMPPPPPASRPILGPEDDDD